MPHTAINRLDNQSPQEMTKQLRAAVDSGLRFDASVPVEKLTPRVWQERFADNPMRSDLGKLVNHALE